MSTEIKPDYGWAGRFGIGTPQANSTVEPEMHRLMPEGVALYGLRLDSPAETLNARLRDFLTALPDLLTRYGSLKLDGFGFACTGSNYMLDEGDAAAAVNAAEQVITCPVITATAAIDAALQQHGAQRLAILSPYPQELHDAGLAFWQRRGFEILRQDRIATVAKDGGHGIYGLTSQQALEGVRAFDPGEADAILLSGTGMPTAAILDQAAAHHGRPVVSSNAALAQALLALVR